MTSDMPEKVYFEFVTGDFGCHIKRWQRSPFDGCKEYIRTDLDTQPPATSEKMVNVPYADGTPSREWTTKPATSDLKGAREALERMWLKAKSYEGGLKDYITVQNALNNGVSE